MIELGQLTSKILELFSVSSVDALGSALMKCVIEGNVDQMQTFCELVDNDLSRDWLQMVYQYYQADRKEKKQDYTPKCLADFMGRLAGEAETIVDMCAGSGALTIQRWNQNHDQKFRLYELDEKVIPYLLFNLAVRNISASVCRADVLQDEVYEQWIVRKGEQFGNVISVKSSV